MLYALVAGILIWLMGCRCVWMWHAPCEHLQGVVAHSLLRPSTGPHCLASMPPLYSSGRQSASTVVLSGACTHTILGCVGCLLTTICPPVNHWSSCVCSLVPCTSSLVSSAHVTG